MKKYFVVVLLNILWLPLAVAQDIQEGITSMSQGSQNGFVVNLPAIDAKSAVNLWKNSLKSYKGKTTYDSKTGEIFTDDATISGLSNNTVDVYARLIEEGKSVVAMAVWFDLGGVYLTSDQHAEEALKARVMLTDYYVSLENELAGNVLASEEKKYESIEKAIKSLDKQLKKLEKDIDKANKVIQKAEKETKKLEQEKERLNVELRDQKEVVRSAEAPLKSKKNN